jgi:hypothetical protein
MKECVCKGEGKRYIYVINSLILFLYIGTGLPVEEQDSSGHFMAYFITFAVVCIAGYIIYHNKQKVNIL